MLHAITFFQPNTLAVMLDSSNVGDGTSKRRALAHAEVLMRDEADLFPL